MYFSSPLHTGVSLCVVVESAGGDWHCIGRVFIVADFSYVLVCIAVVRTSFESTSLSPYLVNAAPSTLVAISRDNLFNFDNKVVEFMRNL